MAPTSITVAIIRTFPWRGSIPGSAGQNRIHEICSGLNERSFEKIMGRNGMRKMRWRLALLMWFAYLSVHAQEPQFLPEVDAHLKLNSSFLTYLEAKDDRD